MWPTPFYQLCRLGVCLCLLTAGCGEPKFYKCEGVITHDGKPVPYLQVEFLPLIVDSVRTPISMTDVEGRFQMNTGRHEGVPPGKYTVHISDPVAPDGRQTSSDPGYLYVIDRYSPEKSDYIYTADQDRLDFEIKLDTKDWTPPTSQSADTAASNSAKQPDSQPSNLPTSVPSVE